jgi:polysaccharide pyruvyl transferase WcaK-like protein
MILMQHGYSARNAGDRLLLDLSLKYVRNALGSRERIALIANDARSFAYLRDVKVIQNPATAPDLINRGRGLAMSLGSRGALTINYGELVGDEVDLVVGVGGGYLRASDCTGLLKFGLAMYPQLKWAAKSGVPSIYLPQSIGPFPSVCREAIGRLISQLNSVFVRDDRSQREWSKCGVTRAPDLAVMELARRIPSLPKILVNSKKIIVIARNLSAPHPRNSFYIKDLQKLVDALQQDHEVVWAVQSAGRGNDDQKFYNKIAVSKDPCISAGEAFHRFPDAIVVSVRLHGSLSALLSGLPTYHISYERKGFAAMQDLGLGEYVCNAFSPNRHEVIGKINDINERRSDYWHGVEARCAVIDKQRDAVLQRLSIVKGTIS